MTIATMVIAIPSLVSVIKRSNKVVVSVSFVVSILFIVLYGFNRMHMGAHFLSDVCFGVLFTYLVFILIDLGCSNLADNKK